MELRLAKGHKTITIPSLILFIVAFLWLLYQYSISMITITDEFIFLAMAILLFFNLQFFRDPVRISDDNLESSILAPADGVLFEIDTTSEPDVSIYRIRMRFWDVHVNYMPFTGTLNSCTKKRGILLPILPGFNKYSKNKNARQTMVFHSENDFDFKVVQISGTLAYRTVAYGKIDQVFTKGDKIGMIRYGSETDLHIPTHLTEPVAIIGSKLKSGKTIIARMKAST